MLYPTWLSQWCNSKKMQITQTNLIVGTWRMFLHCWVTALGRRVFPVSLDFFVLPITCVWLHAVCSQTFYLQVHLRPTWLEWWLCSTLSSRTTQHSRPDSVQPYCSWGGHWSFRWVFRWVTNINQPPTSAPTIRGMKSDSSTTKSCWTWPEHFNISVM